MDVSNPYRASLGTPFHLESFSYPYTSLYLPHPSIVRQKKPQRRVFKTPAPVVEVKARRQRNNGNIEVVPSADYAFSSGGKELYEEVWINARKYMIPEKTIRLDFWDKASERRNGSER